MLSRVSGFVRDMVLSHFFGATAVADAFDAMASDRPYRRGLPEDKVYEIFREGAGTQWDARVVETLERVRDQVHAIGRARRELVQLDLPEWSSPAPAPVAAATLTK